MPFVDRRRKKSNNKSILMYIRLFFFFLESKNKNDKKMRSCRVLSLLFQTIDIQCLYESICLHKCLFSVELVFHGKSYNE